MENGAMSAAKNFSSKWSVSINELTARKLNIWRRVKGNFKEQIWRQELSSFIKSHVI